jgi:hypothetical protein
MQLVDLIHVYQGYLECSKWVGERDAVSILGKLIYHHQNAVEVSRFR